MFASAGTFTGTASKRLLREPLRHFRDLAGLTFAVMLLVPAGGGSYRWFLGLLQWPFRITAAALAASPIPSITPVRFAADPTDLIALPAPVVPFALAVMERGAERLRAGSSPKPGQ